MKCRCGATTIAAAAPGESKPIFEPGPVFDYKTLSVGDIVATPYGSGTVTRRQEEVYVVFEDGSGCSIWEATGLLECKDPVGRAWKLGNCPGCEDKGCEDCISFPA